VHTLKRNHAGRRHNRGVSPTPEHLINDAASLCADPTAADENAYVAASVAGCNCIFLPICGCALAVVAIRDIEDGHELFASYGICSWVDDHGAKARAHAWGRFLGM
jgi:hypothetical protein